MSLLNEDDCSTGANSRSQRNGQDADNRLDDPRCVIPFLVLLIQRREVCIPEPPIAGLDAGEPCSIVCAVMGSPELSFCRSLCWKIASPCLTRPNANVFRVGTWPGPPDLGSSFRVHCRLLYTDVEARSRPSGVILNLTAPNSTALVNFLPKMTPCGSAGNTRICTCLCRTDYVLIKL